MAENNLISKITGTIRKISLLWNYFTVGTLIYFGISFLTPITLWVYAAVVFFFAIVYFALTTAIYVVGPKRKRESQENKNKRSILKILYKIVKVCITILPFLTLYNDLSVNFAFPTLTKTISIIWLIIQINVEVTLFVLKAVARKILKQIKSN